MILTHILFIASLYSLIRTFHHFSFDIVLAIINNYRAHLIIVVTYSQFDSNIRVLYVFWGFLKNI
jgi:hypothetical protein